MRTLIPIFISIIGFLWLISCDANNKYEPSYHKERTTFVEHNPDEVYFEEPTKETLDATYSEKPLIKAELKPETHPQKEYCENRDASCQPINKLLYSVLAKSCSGKACKRELGELTLHPQGILFSVMEEYQAFKRIAKGMMVSWDGNIQFTYTNALTRLQNLLGFAHITLDKEPNSFLSIAIPTANHHNQRLRVITKRSIETGKKYPSWNDIALTTGFRPAVDETQQQILVLQNSQKMASFSLQDGKKNWEVEHSSDWACSPIIDKQSRIFVCDTEGTLYCYSNRGKLVWRKSFIEGLKVTSLSPLTTYLSVHSKGDIYLTDSNTIKVYNSTGTLLYQTNHRMDKKFVVASDRTILFGQELFLWAVKPQPKTKPKKFAQFPYARIPYHPILLTDGSVFFKDATSGISRYKRDGTLQTRFPKNSSKYYFLRMPHPRNLFYPGGTGTILRDNGSVYVGTHHAISTKASDEFIGIMEIRLGLPGIDKQGWPTTNGSFSHKRSIP